MFDYTKTYTYGETLGPAMQITDQAEADAYFKALVDYHVARWHVSRAEAEKSERGNLGYYAGYYDSETRERVERLFRCSHPVFGSIAEKGELTAEEAFAMGKKWGRE